MGQARNTTTERRCPTCEGAGELTVRHASGDPQLEDQATCPEPRCLNGWIEWREPDPLVVMSRKRKFRKLQGGPRWMVGYWDARADAMKPVKLPHDHWADPLFRQGMREAEAAGAMFRMVLGPMDAIFGKRAA